MNKRIILKLKLIAIIAVLLLGMINIANANNFMKQEIQFPQNYEIQNIHKFNESSIRILILENQTFVKGDIVAVYDGYEVTIGKFYGVLYR